MLSKARKSKGKALRLFAACIFLSLVSYLLFQFFTLEKSVVSPLPKNNKSGIQNLEDLLSSSKISYAFVSKTKDFSYQVNLVNGILVFITPKKDLTFQVASLQAILKQLTIEGKVVKSIDFRFDRPVIAF